ncbi:HAD-IC family P-type ATPase, partial [Streptococcus pyogenes]|uniref:HAD-IC family P-type ATPase n=1 Tax=Streptococcus pyogenes TaxID=1314 RepID=UPI0011E626A3
LGEAIVKYGEEMNIKFEKVDNFKAIPGAGIQVTINDESILLGNRKLMNDNNIKLGDLEEKSNILASQGKTPMYIAVDGNLSGIIAVADVVKESSKKAIEILHDMGIKVAMVTGDNAKTANAIANQVGID